ncbi:response regulator [Qipengyuania sp. DGS5-3]|uniref:response regulator n=1 Tax=Qipengyuania sp. DGS5-3 TaxID=3349632 RepID=UPI0036D2B164
MTNPSAPWSRITNSLWGKLSIAGAMAAICAAAVMLAFQCVASIWGWHRVGTGDASFTVIFTIAMIMGAAVFCAGLGRHIARILPGALKANGGATCDAVLTPINEIDNQISSAPPRKPTSAPEPDTPSVKASEPSPLPATPVSAHFSAAQEHDEAPSSSAISSKSPGPQYAPYARFPADGRILLAETNDHDRRAITSMIGRCGMEVEIAIDAENAIELLLAANEFGEPFDLALIDAYMHQSDGSSVCRAVRSAGIQAEAMPIITLLPDTLIGDATSRTPAQSQAHIFKPVMMEDLVRTLNRWLPHRIVEESTRPIDDPLDDLDIDEVEDELQRWITRRSDAVSTIERAIAHHAFDGRSRRLLANALRQIARAAGLYGEEELGKHAAILERALHDGDTAGDCRKLAEAFLAAAQQTADA